MNRVQGDLVRDPDALFGTALSLLMRNIQE